LENVANFVARKKHNEAVPNKPQFVKNGRGYKATFYMYSSVHMPMNCLENAIIVIARHPPPPLLNNNKEEQLTPQQFL